MSVVLDYFRSVDPRFNDVPDAELSDFIVARHPEFLKDEEFATSQRVRFGQEANQQRSTEDLRQELEADVPHPFGTSRLGLEAAKALNLGLEPASITSAPMGRALVRGGANIVEGLTGAYDAAESAMRQVGIPSSPVRSVSQLLSNAVRNEARDLGAALPAEGPASLSEVTGPADLAALAIERGIGEQIPQLALGAATAGGGTLLGLSPKAAGIFGSILSTFPQETGGAYQEILDRTGVEAPGTAAAVGAVNSFLETLGEGKLLERILGGDQLVATTVGETIKKLLGRGAGLAGREAGVEAAQELTTALAPSIYGAPVPEDLATRVGTAATLGAVGGWVFSGAVDAVRAPGDMAENNRLLTPPPEQQENINLRTLLEQQDPGSLRLDFSEGLPTRGSDQIGFVEGLGGVPAITTPRLDLSGEQQAAIDQEQARASELLQRVAIERQVAEAEASQAEQAGRQDLANLRRVQSFTAGLDAMLEVGQAAANVRELTIGPIEFTAVAPNAPQLSAVPAAVSVPAGVVAPATSNILPADQAARRDRGLAYVWIEQMPSGEYTVQSSVRGLQHVGNSIAEAESFIDSIRPYEGAIQQSVDVESANNKASDAVRQGRGREYTPAIMGDNGKVYPADSHSESSDLVVRDGAQPKTRGFVTQDGRFLTLVDVARAEMLKKSSPTPTTTPDANPIQSPVVVPPAQPPAVVPQVAEEVPPGVQVPPIAQPETLTPSEKRQSGTFFNIQMTPSREAAIADLRAVPYEEIERAVGGKIQADETGDQPVYDVNGMVDPQTNQGWLTRYMHFAKPMIQKMAEGRGIQLDAEAAAYMERVWQEIAMDQYTKAQSRGVKLPKVFSYREAFRGALTAAKRAYSTAGKLRGSVTSTEITTDTGESFVPSEVEEAVREAKPSRSSSGFYQDLQDWLDSFTTPQQQAAMNIIAQFNDQRPPHKKPSPERQAFEQDPEFQQMVETWLNQNPRDSISLNPPTPLSIEAVRAFAQKLGVDMTRVQIIDDPEFVNALGQPLRGRYVPTQAQPFILNARYLGTEKDVRDALREELLHGAFGAPEVQSAWLEVQNDIQAEDWAEVEAYDPAVRPEEAAIRRVLRELETRRITNPVRKFLNALVAAVKRLFGVQGVDAYDAIIKRALEARIGGGEVRDSLAKGMWKSAKEAREEAATAGDPEAILRSAAAQGSIVPQKYVDLLTAPPTTGEQRVTQRLLKPAADAVTMARDLGSNFGVISPSGALLQSGMQLGDADALDIAAEAIVKQSLRLQQVRGQIDRTKVEASDALERAVGKLPEAQLARNSADLYKGLSDQLAKDYRLYLKQEALTMRSGGFTAQQRQELNDASRRITEEYRGASTAIGQALRMIAKEIPTPALGDINATRQWIEQRVNDPAQPRLMSDEAREWLLAPVGTRVAPLMRDQYLNTRLAAVQSLARDEKDALDGIKALRAEFKGKKVSPEMFARKWGALRTKHREALNTLRAINGEISRQEDRLNGAEAAGEILDQILADPEYQQPVTEAVAHLGATSTVRKYVTTDGGQHTGQIVYGNPLTGEPVILDLQPDVDKERENREKVSQLLKDVQQWMSTTTDPVARNAWEKESDWLKRYGLQQAPAIFTGHQVKGYSLPSFWQVNPLTSLIRPFNVRGPGYNRIGNRLIRDAHQAATVYSQIDKELRQLSEDFELPVGQAMAKAAVSHGYSGSDAKKITQWWIPEIFEPLVSQRQNPTATPYRVGDEIRPGVKVTAEDVEAVNWIKKRDQAVFNLLQKAEKDSAMGLLYYNPLQTAEEASDTALSRRSTDYGWKLPRRPASRPNEWAGNFVREWLEAAQGDSTVRRALIDQNFDRVLMGNGLLGNTDREFTPKGIAEKDAKIFSTIPGLIRSGNLPFKDLDELVDWVGQQQATVDLSQAEASAEFEQRLIGYVDTFVREYNNALSLVPTQVKQLLDKLKVPAAQISSIGINDSPFVKPRGKMVAPPSFYTYNIADSGAFGTFTAGIRSALTLREIEAANAALAALDKEVARFENQQTGEIARLQKQMEALPWYKRTGPRSPRRAVARRSKLRAEQGELMYDYNTLKRNQETLRYTLGELERLGSEHVLMREDNNAIQASRAARGGLTSALLQSIVSMTNNALGGVVSTTLFNRGLGSWKFATTPLTMLKKESQYVVGSALKKLRMIPGANPTMKALLATPLVRNLAEQMIAQQMVYEQDRAAAVAARTVDQPNWREKARLQRQFPDTAGRVTDEDVNPLVWLINRLSSTPGLAEAGQLSMSTFPGGIDRLVNQALTADSRGRVDDIGEKLFMAWKNREATIGPGWDDLNSVQFTAKDLGLPSETAVGFIRNLLAGVGSPEALGLELYNRRKTDHDAPFLSEGQIQQVAQEVARSTNMSSAMNTPTAFQGRGWSGEMRKWLFMLLRYPINFAAVNENIAGKVYGDNTKGAKAWAAMSAVAAVVITALMLAGGSELGQEAREVVTGDPRTRQSLETILNDPTLGDLAKYAGISMSSIAPFWGERIAQTFGGSSGRPNLLDATQMFAPLGFVADAEKMVRNILQTGDFVYPMADFTRRYMPLSSAVINRTLPGEVEAREGIRAVRVAAPADMEQRSAGGGGGRQTPQTPLIREATSKALAGDMAGSQRAIEEAIRLRVEAGADPKDARRSVEQSFNSRNPENLIFGKKLTDDERSRLESRMSGPQLAAYRRSQGVFGSKTRSRRKFRGSRRTRSRRRRSRR